MAASLTSLVLTGRDAAADRAALARLVEFQSTTATAGLPVPTSGEQLALLEAFRLRHLPAVAADAKPWRRAADALVADAVAQVPVALWPDAAAAGPLLHDIARLLGEVPLEEDVAIDLTVRWWQAARHAGLAVDADFGECWRGIEWQALMQALVALGRGAAEPARVAQAVRIVLRYGQLKPLLPLLQPLTGAAPNAGYTF